MERRAFLRLLGLGAAAVAAAPLVAELDPERLLWIPGAKTFFLPVEPGSRFVTMDWIAREALRILNDNMRMLAHIDRQYDKALQMEGTVLTALLPRIYSTGGRTTRILPPDEHDYTLITRRS